MILKNKKSFSQFLNIASGQKEVSITIAKNQKEQDDFIKILSENGFKKSDAVYELLENPKTYFVASKNIDKNIYDFIVQYPTGQVEIFDKNIMKSNLYTPEYKDKVVIIVALKNNLKKLQKKNFDLLALTGPAYQS
jgi:hypothetical protein